MFLPREKKIIEILSNVSRPVTISELAFQLKLSNKTVSNSIQQMKSILSEYDAAICSKPAVGVWLECSNDDLCSLKEDLEAWEEQFDDRKIRIAKILLGNRHYQSLESIAEKSFYSKSTVHREIQELKPFFKKHQLSIQTQKNRGIRISGDEAKVRIAEAELIKLEVQRRTEFEITTDLKRYFPEKLLKQILGAVSIVERENNLELPYLSKQGLLIHLAITINRTQKGHRMRLSEDEMQELSLREEWQIAQQLLSLLESELDIHLDDNECGYITIHLMGACLISKDQYLNGKDKTISMIDRAMFDRLAKIISQLSRDSELPFDQDMEFMNRLFLHVKPMINRLVNGITLHNPFVEEIKKFHNSAYELAIDLSNGISKEFQVTLDENEIAYIAMHVGTVLEILDKQQEPIRIVIVCASGRGTSHFLKTRIENRFPEFKIIDVLSSLKLDDYKEKMVGKYDYILSTIPLEHDENDIITISPLLSQKDMDKLAKLKRVKYFQKYPISQRILSEFLFEEISMFNVSVQNFEEAIKLLGGKMLQHGFAGEGFIESVVEREILSSTCVGNLVAIPHAFEGHVKRQGIGVLIAKKPFQWKDPANKIQMIFLLGIDSKSSKKFSSIFSEIVDLVESTELMTRILQIKAFDEFKKTIL